MELEAVASSTSVEASWVVPSSEEDVAGSAHEFVRSMVLGCCAATDWLVSASFGASLFFRRCNTALKRECSEMAMAPYVKQSNDRYAIT